MFIWPEFDPEPDAPPAIPEKLGSINWFGFCLLDSCPELEDPNPLGGELVPPLFVAWIPGAADD